MSALTRTEIRSAAECIISTIPPVQAVVLFGSRARGGARTDSDWDLAVLAPLRLRKSIRKRLPVIEDVNIHVLDPEHLAHSVNFAGSLAFAMARDGQVLAGHWKRPKRSILLMDHDTFVRQMVAASVATRDAITSATNALLEDNEEDDETDSAVTRSQNAAELVAKCAFMVHGLEPERVHDLSHMAMKFEARFPGHEWSERMLRLNGETHALHQMEYGDKHPGPDALESSIVRASGAAQFHLEVLRAYAERIPEQLNNIHRITSSATRVIRILHAVPDWNHLSDRVREELEAWVAGVAQVEKHAGSASLQREPGRILIEDDPDQSHGLGY